MGGPLIYYIYFGEGRTEQFLFLDPDNPGGAVRIRIRDFRQAYGRIIFPNYQVSELRMTGYCEFTKGGSAPTTRQCEIVFTLTGMSTSMNLDVLDYARRSIYHAGGVPTVFYPH